ncbi:hypothetical protein ZWY2020_009721 [Hordeum vulgare]|nr:hypothetical protein ZWY2020_009721 [Hordeum vulgare]
MVVLADVQDELGAHAGKLGGPDTACYIRCDVTDEAQVAAVDLAVARHGRLDVMFNNAGITGSYAAARSKSLDMADFDRVAAVNLRGVAASIKQRAPLLAPAARCILCVHGGRAGRSGPHAYSVSDGRRRHGDAGASARGRRRQGKEEEEEVVRRVFEEDLNEMGGGVVLRAEDVASGGVLASDDARYITRHNLMVDGGFSVAKPLSVPAS